MRVKLPKKYLDQFRRAAARGGRSGSKADKIRASLAAAEVRAEKAYRLSWNGQTHTVAEWSRLRGIPKGTIWARIRAHKPPHQVLKTTNKNHQQT